MTDTPDNTAAALPDTNLVDTDLRTLFAAVQPTADFEDRLVTAVRRHRRLRLAMPARFPLAVQRAAIAAAAMLAVGVTGYVGNRVMLGSMRPLRTAFVGAGAHSSGPYGIGKNDLMSITVEDLAGNTGEMTKQARVDENGNISMAKLGLVKAEGLTEDGLQALIADEYRDRHIFMNPQVTISVTESRNSYQQNLVKTDPDMLADGLVNAMKSRAVGSKQNINPATVPKTYALTLKDTDAKADKSSPADWMSTPFTGSQHDNIFTGRNKGATNEPLISSGTITKGTAVSSPYDNLDSILLPYASQGDEPAPVTTTPAPTGGRGSKDGDSNGSMHITGFRYDSDAAVANGSTNHRDAGAIVEKALSISDMGFKSNAASSSSLKPGLDIAGGTSLNYGINGQVKTQTTPIPKPTYFASTGPDGDFSKGNSDMYWFGPSSGQERGQTPLSSHGSTATQDKTVGDLVQDARNFIDVGKYTEALAVVDSIKKIDPNSAYAGGVQPFLEDKSKSQQEREKNDHFNTEFTHQLNDAKERIVPYDDVIRSSSDWPKTSEMRDKESTGAAAHQMGGQQLAIATPAPVVPSNPNPNEAQAPAPVAAPRAPAPAVDDRKIIRTGSMEFDVDRFDTAQMQITKIVGELGGFVGATDSQKLPNGKVRGSISVRVAPERLDVLVLSLRALGDLKSQQITAADITKEYTDIQSELAADRAMQDRLLELIHDGKGSVKDLLAAENELGNWRTKIEKAEGMIRYYNGQVALSTLSITMTERDIQTPATAVETETADVGIEADDVEKARNSAMKAIDDVKGRIVEAELKRFDAGQLAARLVADVPPESAGAVIDQLKQLGKVARLEIHRQQQNTDGSGMVMASVPAMVESDYVIVNGDQLSVAVDDLDALGMTTTKELQVNDRGEITLKLLGQVKAAGMTAGQLQKAIADEYRNKQIIPNAQVVVKVTDVHGKRATAPTASIINPIRTERKPTRLLISIYNLANVAPRRTTNVSLAAADVESAYTALVAATKSSGGRVVTSALDRGDPVKATGSLVLEFPPEKFDAALATLHAQGEVLNLNLTENPDTQNSTEAKAGLTVKLVSLANVAPRRTTNVSLAANDVSSAYAALVNVTKSSGGRVVNSTLDQGDPAKATGALMLELPPEKLDAAISTLHAQGEVLNLNLAESRDTQNSTDAKVGLTVKLISMATVKPLETVQQTLAAVDVPAAYQAILTAASVAHARVQSASLNEQDRQNITGEIDVEVPRANAAEFDKTLNAAGGTISRTSARAADAEGAVDSKVLIRLTITSADHLAPRETTKLLMEVGDVDKSAASAQAAAIGVGGRVLVSKVSKDHGRGVAWVGLDFPLAKSGEVLQQVRGEGTVRGIDASRDPQAPSGPMAHAYIEVEFRTADAIVADQTGPWASVRQGLSTSINGLLWSLQWVVVGLCLIGPWVLLAWIGWKIKTRMAKPRMTNDEIRVPS